MYVMCCRVLLNRDTHLNNDKSMMLAELSRAHPFSPRSLVRVVVSAEEHDASEDMTLTTILNNMI